MKRLILASALAIAASLPVAAQAAEPAGNMKLTQAQCDTLWKQANPTNAKTITEAQAMPFVSDVKAANPDNDGSLDKAEFAKACSSGLVKSSSAGSTGSGSSSGSGSGESGAATPAPGAE